MLPDKITVSRQLVDGRSDNALDVAQKAIELFGVDAVRQWVITPGAGYPGPA